jgi:outer membrane protein OmpA-like peptidoglycan-associated protein
VQGRSGQTGDRGAIVAGIAGNAGPSGFQGERGGAGPTGAQGAVGIVERWSSYRQVSFDRRESNIRASEMDKVSDIAAYLLQNPTLEVGIDGSMAARGSNQRDRDLSNLRADSVRDALMQAGVPAYKIQMGAFADPDRRQLGQIQVLIKTRT